MATQAGTSEMGGGWGPATATPRKESQKWDLVGTQHPVRRGSSEQICDGLDTAHHGNSDWAASNGPRTSHTKKECKRKKAKNLGVMPRLLTLEKEVLKTQG